MSNVQNPQTTQKETFSAMLDNCMDVSDLKAEYVSNLLSEALKSVNDWTVRASVINGAEGTEEEIKLELDTYSFWQSLERMHQIGSAEIVTDEKGNKTLELDYYPSADISFTAHVAIVLTSPSQGLYISIPYSVCGGIDIDGCIDICDWDRLLNMSEALEYLVSYETVSDLNAGIAIAHPYIVDLFNDFDIDIEDYSHQLDLDVMAIIDKAMPDYESLGMEQAEKDMADVVDFMQLQSAIENYHPSEEEMIAFLED